MESTTIKLYARDQDWKVECPIQQAKKFEYLQSMMDYEDPVTKVEISVGDLRTSQQTEKAVKAMECLIRLNNLVDVVNAGGKSLEDMWEYKKEFVSIYKEWEALIGENEVYEWLAPSMEMTHKVTVNYKDDRHYPIAWMRNKCSTFYPDSRILKDSFRELCKHGHESIAKWLYSLGGVDDDGINGAFCYACENGHLRVAKWLYSLGGVDDGGINESFGYACGNGHLHVARWVYSLDEANIYEEYEEMLRSACRKVDLRTVRWLCSLYEYEDEYEDEYEE